LAQALRKNAFCFKVTSRGVRATLAAMASILYAHYITYLNPTRCTVTEFILDISMVTIASASSTWSPLVEGVGLVTLPEALRFAGSPQFHGRQLAPDHLWRPPHVYGGQTRI
jgi:branched-chain amino acid transport system permease protein